MTDARFPEQWLNDRQVVRLSDAAFRLFVTTLAWSASNRTDGHLDGDDLALIHGVDAKAADELVHRGLWTLVDDGWRVVDYHKTQATRAQLEGLDHKRHQDRERQARHRARQRESGVTRDITRDGMRDTEDRTGRTGQASNATTTPRDFDSDDPWREETTA